MTGALVQFARVPAAQPTPHAASTLYVVTAAWAIAGIFFAAVLWPNDDAGGIADNGTALILLALCLLGANVSFALAAILQQLAQRQVTENG